jgi:hypothetical protein
MGRVSGKFKAVTQVYDTQPNSTLRFPQNHDKKIG